MDRLISLGIGVEGAENWINVFQDISELARNLAEVHPYVNVTATRIGVDDDVVDEPEELYHDENTLIKVYGALEGEGVPHYTAVNLVNAMQNAGILFRERPRSIREGDDRDNTVDTGSTTS